jgi:hypothetical protein
MNNQKILICSVSFYPRISPRSQRATELAKEFARLGHEVNVLTLNDRQEDIEKFAKTHAIKVDDFVNGKYSFKRTRPKGAIGMITKVIDKLLLFLFLWPDIKLTFLLKNKLLTLDEKYDLIISIAIPFPVHWGVALALDKNRDLTKVWVADCGDPFIGNKESKIKIPFYFRYLENWFCKKPDFITVPISKAVNAYPESCRRKIKIIPQGFNFDEVPESKIVKNVIPTFAYAGALSEIRNPKQFLNFLDQLNIDFRFYVYTRSKAFLSPFINKMGKKVIVKDYVPRLQLLDELTNMDFVVNFENRHDVQSPSKLIDYSLIKKPILSINCDHLDKQKVGEFLNGDYAKSFKVNNIEQYDIKNICTAFLKLNNSI